MTILKLINGEETFIDDIDLPLVSHIVSWRILAGYVASRGRNYRFLHNILLNPSSNQRVDHIDGNPLNNQRSNLRLCTIAENTRNRKTPSTNTSGTMGVRRFGKKWLSSITFNGTYIYLGLFLHYENAVKARKEAELKYFGEFAKQ